MGMLTVPGRGPGFGRVRRGASGLTLIEMSMLIGLVGIAIIGLAEREFAEAREREASLTETLTDIQVVTDALTAWADDNAGRTRWPYHLFSLISGCNHSGLTPGGPLQTSYPEYYARLGSCHTHQGRDPLDLMRFVRPGVNEGVNSPNAGYVTGAYLLRLPASRFPPDDCTAQSGGVDCEYHFEKSGWETVDGTPSPPQISEGVTVQFVIQRADSSSVARLAQSLVSSAPSVTTAPVPGFDNRRFVRFRVFPPIECTAEADLPYEADPLVYWCNEGRVVRFERADLRNLRRVALRGTQESLAGHALDTVPLTGPGITLPAAAESAVSYRMRIGTQGVERDQYLELVRDKVAGGVRCTSSELFGHRSCGLSALEPTYNNARRASHRGYGSFPAINAIREHAYPGLQGDGNTPLDVDLLQHYNLITAAHREVWEFDPAPLVRLRVSDRIEVRGGGSAEEREAPFDFLMSTDTGLSPQTPPIPEPYVRLCADHAAANVPARIVTTTVSFRGTTLRFPQFVDEPCKTGVALEMSFRDDSVNRNRSHWDIRLNGEAGHRSLSERLCALEALPGGQRDLTCR